MLSRYFSWPSLRSLSISSSVFCSPSFLPSFYVVNALPLPSLILYLPLSVQSMSISVSSRLSQPIQSQYLTQIYWHCFAALSHSQFLPPAVKHKFSTFHRGFPFLNFIIFVNLTHIFASSRCCHSKIPRSFCTVFIPFPMFHKYAVHISSNTDLLVLSRCTNFTQNTLNHHSTCPSKITFYNLQNGLREKHMKKLLVPENVNLISQPTFPASQYTYQTNIFRSSVLQAARYRREADRTLREGPGIRTDTWSAFRVQILCPSILKG